MKNAAHCDITNQFQAMMCAVLEGSKKKLCLANGLVHATSIKTNVTLHFGHKPAILPEKT